MARHLIVIIILMIGGCQLCFAQQSNSSAKRERNFLKEGNELYNQKRYAEAEVAYRKALQENVNSEIAQFNLASALLKQVSLASGQEDTEGNKTRLEARQMLQNLATGATDTYIAENALYNLGNMSFNEAQYQQSIDFYKRTLRKNPDNDNARDNLRLAQLKLEEQQNQNQDQNQDQDKNQDQNQDQDKQNQDQNQNQEDQQKQDQQNQNQQNQEQQQNQDQKDQGGISDRNAEQILKAMENQENATRRKVEAEKLKEEQSRSRYNTDKPW